MFKLTPMGITLEQFERNGYVVIPEFLWPEECDELLEASYELSNELVQQNNKATFSTQHETQLTDDYFIESNDKIRTFYEKGALDKDGNFIVDPRFSVNKIGHALHLLHPLFRCYTYCDRVKSVVRQMKFNQPTVVQSMVIFKNPHVSSEVQPHQDATYLYAEPYPVVGFWIALDDVTIENGCLWVISGSHKSGVHRRLMRNPNTNSTQKLIYDRPAPVYPASSFTPIIVPKGSCVLLHGHVVHKSSFNKTNKPRPAYTFHIVEKLNNIFGPENWLQEGPAAPFENMYNVEQILYPADSSGEVDVTLTSETSHQQSE